MFEEYLRAACILTVALLFGGMLFFSASFAAFLFKYLPQDDARMLIRKAFPPFYLFVVIASGTAVGLSLSTDVLTACMLAFVMLTAVVARQRLMPAINHATDTAQKKRFAWLHGFSVVLTLSHIVVCAVALVHMVN